MKVLLWIVGPLALIVLFAFFAGYFDPELTEDRRLYGCSMIIAGIALALPAVIRVADDWPRMKPQHNVDLAFIQIGGAVVILTVALLLGGRFGAFASKSRQRLRSE